MTNHQRIDEVAEEDKDALSDKNMNNEIFEVIFPTQIWSNTLVVWIKALS